MTRNRISVYLASMIAAIAIMSAPQRASAQLLELALIIDGSSSISGPNGNMSGPDWGLQIGAYQSVFQNNFYTNFIVPSQFDQIAVAAYVFSGGYTETVTVGSTDYVNNVVVSSFIDWALIDSDATASAFGAQFAGLPQPGGTTHTSGAIDIAVNGGQVSCLDASICSPTAAQQPPFTTTAAGLLNNAYDGDRLVIDISTDGVPTEPNGGGTPNQADSDLAIAAADNARAAGITVNALGVGGVDTIFLDALVGVNPSASPAGFVITASDFTQFQTALLSKIGQETAVVPLPAAIWLFGSGLLGIAGIARRGGRKL